MRLRNATEADWQAQIDRSRETYDAYYRTNAPGEYRRVFAIALDLATSILERTNCLREDVEAVITADPTLLRALRNACVPPLAADRLENLAKVAGNYCDCEKDGRLRGSTDDLARVAQVVEDFANPELQLLHDEHGIALAAQLMAPIIANRLFDAWFRNSLESTQQEKLRAFLKPLGYEENKDAKGMWAVPDIGLHMKAGEFSFGRSVVYQDGRPRKLPIDCILMPLDASKPPLLLELKSAGDETNTNKRGNEENQKATKLANTYPGVPYIYAVDLWGYFGLQYARTVSEHMDFVWDDDLANLHDLGV